MNAGNSVVKLRIFYLEQQMCSDNSLYYSQQVQFDTNLLEKRNGVGV